MDKLWSIQTMDYSALKRNELSNHEKTWRNLKCIARSERSQSENTIVLYDSNYMSSWNRQNYGDSEQISGGQGSGQGTEGWINGAQRALRAVKLLCMIPSRWIHVVLLL